VARVATGSLNPQEQREIGFPWSPEMVERSRRSVGATIAACRAALQDGFAVNLAGGTHHSYASRGAGFCVFNDAAVAARVMQAEALERGDGAQQIAIVDLDVHQGNGTAAIFQDDPSVFTLSLHGESNYPFKKEFSDLDVALPDNCNDDAYMKALEKALTTMFERVRPTMLIYLAGADPHAGDRLGRLALSIDGLAQRDSLVFAKARERGLPVAIAMAGGYGRDIDLTVDIHVQTIQLAAVAAALRTAKGGFI
jgi:acetoin utilization deacetylase AcuC-like enzyme